MRHRTGTTRLWVAVGTALVLLLPLVAGCGGPGKEDTAGGSYYTGKMKGKTGAQQPAPGATTGQKPTGE